MSDVAIRVENLSKLYQLGEVGTGTLSRDVERWWARVRGKEDPFAKIGQVNDRTAKAESDFVWALKDIDFEVKKGEVLGIIGRNGAGKSTLLKILSKITSPTTGKIYLDGRIASLLEVGTGFHPELTGRENIFMNGAILGMRKKEIQKKFDAIVDFAGVEKYIDTPVKRYSSGMYVRLAFAVAAYLEPEILIVDEVLAVGDAEFQKKCLGRMKDVSVNDGRTVLFVSHNLYAINQLCMSSILLKNGSIMQIGKTQKVLEMYSSILNENFDFKNPAPSNNCILEIDLLNTNGIKKGEFLFSEEIRIRYKIKVEDWKAGLTIGFNLYDSFEVHLFTAEHQISADKISSFDDNVILCCSIPSYFLMEGSYKIVSALHIPNKEIIHQPIQDIKLVIINDESSLSKYKNSGLINVNTTWI
jgi:lipopolysaccharide transport system ATP-binding protein